jgi:hypothetical protein
MDDWLKVCEDYISMGGELMSCLLAAAPQDKLDPSQLTRDELIRLTKAHARARIVATAGLKKDNPKEWLSAANLNEGLGMFMTLLRPTRSLVPGYEEVTKEAQAALLFWLRKKFNHNPAILSAILEAFHEDAAKTPEPTVADASGSEEVSPVAGDRAGL